MDEEKRPLFVSIGRICRPNRVGPCRHIKKKTVATISERLASLQTDMSHSPRLPIQARIISWRA